MKIFKEIILITLALVLVGGGISWVSKSGAQDRSFYVYDYSAKKEVSVTERNIRQKFEIAPSEEGCDLMGICKVGNKTMLSPKKYGE